MDLNPFITTDMSLTSNAGDKVIINKYTATGNVEDLAMGEGNTQGIEVSYAPEEYVVKVTQGKFEFYDEQENKDPKIVDVGLEGVSAQMTNDMVSKIINAYGRATLKTTYTKPNFDAFVDGVATLNMEDNSGLFSFVNPKTSAEMKKALKDDLKYIEAFVRTGYIGTVNGINVYTTKAMPDDKIYIATREAVTNFIKKGAEVEYKRDPDKRFNQYWLRKTQVIALTDATKVVELSKGSSTPTE